MGKKVKGKTNLFHQNEENYSLHFNFEPISSIGMIFLSSNILGSEIWKSFQAIIDVKGQMIETICILLNSIN